MSRRPAFTVHLDGFDGPLDLLLHLIEKRELDITTISLAQVADLYLGHVRAMQPVDPDSLAEFISVGAKLLLIKSSVLLPDRARTRDGEEVDDPTDLTERLLIYRAIKDASSALREREERGLRSYGRLTPLEPPPRLPASRPADDLLKALQRLAVELARRPPVVTVEREVFSIGEKIELLRHLCRTARSVSLKALLEGRGRGEIVATFLALLELLRLGEVNAEQSERFGDILVLRSPT